MNNTPKSFRCGLLLALLALFYPFVSAEVILSYGFTGLPGNQASTPCLIKNENISVSNLAVGSGLVPLSASNSMSATGFSTGGAAGVLTITNNDYWEFSITPNQNHAFTVDSIQFSYIRSTNGPQNLAIRSSLDNYASNLSPAKTAIPGGVGQSLLFDLAEIGYIEGPVTFRLYGYGATTAGGSGGLRAAESFTVNGSVHKVLAKYGTDGLAGNEQQLVASLSSPGLNMYPMVRGSGLGGAVLVANTFCATGWTTGAQSVTGDYFEFTVSPKFGRYSVTALCFNEYNNVNGPAYFTIRSSLDSFQANLVTPIAKSGSQAVRSHVITLGEQFEDIRVPVIFRFYAWGAVSGAGVWGLGGAQSGNQLVLLGSVLDIDSIAASPEVALTVQKLGRALVNDDGDFTYKGGGESQWRSNLTSMVTSLDASFPDGSLAYSLATGTDVMLYPTTVGSRWGWDSTVTVPGGVAQFPIAVQAGHDGVRWAAEDAGSIGLGFIPVYRMNDAHYISGTMPWLEGEFWRDHRATFTFQTSPFTVSQDPSGELDNYKELLDYAKDEVCQHRLAVITEAIDRYKDTMNGFELDFLRAPAFFHQEDVADYTSVMTAFVGEVREKLDLAGIAVGRDLSLLVRVPASIDKCEFVGLDVRRWVTDGLVDVLIPAQAMTLLHDTALDEFIEMARPAGVAVYPSLYQRVQNTYDFQSTPPIAGNPISDDASEALIRAAILNHQSMQADGFETYNFNLPLSANLADAFSGIYELTSYQSKKRVYAITPTDSAVICKLSEPVKQLHMRLDASARIKCVNIYVGEDVLLIPANSYVGLRLGFGKEDMKRQWLSVTVNGVVIPLTQSNSDVTWIPPASASGGPFSYIQLRLDNASALLRRGYNDVRLEYLMSSTDIAGAVGATQNERERMILTEVQLGVIPSGA